VRLNQVKIPVTDLQRSVSWYCELLDLGLWREFVEQGILCGAVLTDEDRDLRIGLRLREMISGTPAFPGFDLFSLAVDSLDELQAVVARCDNLGLSHGDVTMLGADGTIVDVPDPDGTVIRFILLSPDRERSFAGVDLRSDGQPAFYDTPRLGI
jgi:catechol 2,3-dioxygenase-like lactoylglutathione lyase family enzyme